MQQAAEELAAVQAEPIDSDSEVDDHHSPPPPQPVPSPKPQNEFAKVRSVYSLQPSRH